MRFQNNAVVFPVEISPLHIKTDRDVTKTLIGGGLYIHIFMFCPTSFFSNQNQISQFEKKSFGQNKTI